MKFLPSGLNLRRKQGGFSTLTRVKLGTMFRWNPLEVFRDFRLVKIQILIRTCAGGAEVNLISVPVVRSKHLSAHQPGHDVLWWDPPRREARWHAGPPLGIALVSHHLFFVSLYFPSFRHHSIIIISFAPSDNLIFYWWVGVSNLPAFFHDLFQCFNNFFKCSMAANYKESCCVFAFDDLTYMAADEILEYQERNKYKY